MPAYTLSMRPLLFGLMLALSVARSPAQQPVVLSADAMMARVAANQDSSEAERHHYVYIQHAHVISRKGKTVMCEETTDVRLTPTDKGTHQQLLKLDGKLRHKGGYVAYTKLPSKDARDKDVDNNDPHFTVEAEDDGMDRELVENMRDNLTNDKSKDGIGAGLFPLTSKNQADYQFKLVGREARNGHDCFHILFSPKDKDDFGWKGDAWIDTTAYQPVLVRTAMAHNIPFAVRTLLGTSVPGLGFTVTYEPQPDGIWFPVTFGTEFKLHLFFFLNREIILDARNRDFEKTHVSSKIVDGQVTEVTHE